MVFDTLKEIDLQQWPKMILKMSKTVSKSKCISVQPFGLVILPKTFFLCSSNNTRYNFSILLYSKFSTIPISPLNPCSQEKEISIQQFIEHVVRTAIGNVPDRKKIVRRSVNMCSQRKKGREREFIPLVDSVMKTTMKKKGVRRGSGRHGAKTITQQISSVKTSPDQATYCSLIYNGEVESAALGALISSKRRLFWRKSDACCLFQ